MKLSRRGLLAGLLGGAGALCAKAAGLVSAVGAAPVAWRPMSAQERLDSWCLPWRFCTDSASWTSEETGLTGPRAWTAADRQLLARVASVRRRLRIQAQLGGPGLAVRRLGEVRRCA